ncbi:MAG TPA: response regulator transcription factor, partial [Spirochaetota bacterium]|nr:response regulator transcription factor [Spirochaetota bacterium]
SICKELRKKNILKPILMLTAKNTTKDKVMGLDSGADDYLTKPFAFEEFLARVRALLRKKNIQETSKIKIDDLEIDLLTHEVKRSGKDIILTTKEYALLEYLIRHIGTIVTRTMITENVWDINFDSLTNVVDVYINYLRNKIDKGHEKKLIKTIRGRGYKIQT